MMDLVWEYMGVGVVGLLVAVILYVAYKVWND